MLFRRREPLSISDKIRNLIWPRAGLKRSFRYMKLRLLRISASPRAVATGVAIGVGVAWTPFLGVHIVIAMVLGYICRANLVAAALGTTFANPLTFPFIWASTWELGHVMLGRDNPRNAEHFDFAALFGHFDFRQIWTPVLEPMLIGAIVPGIVCAIVAYIAVYAVIRSFRLRKHQQLVDHAANRNSAMGTVE